MSNKARARQFITLLKQGNYAGAEQMMDAHMKLVLPAERLAPLWQSVIAQLGSLKSFAEIRVEPVSGGLEKDTVVGQFEKAKVDLQLAFNPDGTVSGFYIKPPAGKTVEPPYTKKDSFREIAVKVGSGRFALDGTLSIPTGDGPFPCLVLVHGSGPNDRDETVLSLKPFRDLAWGLSSQGIAVLRYEKRTKQHAAEMAKSKDKITVKEETVDDAVAAAHMLRQQAEIAQDKIYVLGHSLGGFLIPKIAAETPDCAGYIIMAGTARPLADVMLEQIEYLASIQGPPSKEAKHEIESLRMKLQRIKEGKLSRDTPESDLPAGASAAYWLALRDYQATLEIKNVDKPLLILQGESDYQVTMKDFACWKDALAGRTDVTFKLYPGLSHCFVKAGAKPGPQDYEKPQNVDQQVLSDIAAWIKSEK